ncbi:hypothetical protein [Rubrivirga sp. IMCC45206]|uniref:hypothetical protein n=1 Tax=Rubrivirga sp. IMCC45206 TaxID=3391614 RepID=UPI00399039D0
MLATVASAQVPDRVAATVTQIAGADAYLDVGRDDGLATGDTVRVWRGARLLGPMRVVSAASASSLVAHIAEPFALTRGETVELELPARAPPEPVAPAPTPVAERPSILDTPAERPAPTRSPVRVSGRVQLGADALASTTTFGDRETTRQFTTPFVSVRADVTGLPGGWRGRVNGRGLARMQDGSIVDGGTETRVYALDLEGRIAGAHVRLGRFVPRRERFTGAWDGADVHVGTDSLGAGVVAGWRASRVAGLPDGERPGGLAYAFTARRLGTARLRASASGGAIIDGDALPFAGAALSADGGARDGVRLRASADLLADARPGGAWDWARASARASAVVSRRLTLRGYARRYRPSVVDGALLIARFQPSRAVGGGASVAFGPAVVRGDVSLRASSGGDWSRALSGGFRLSRLGSIPVGVDASATAWARDGGRAWFASGGLSCAPGPVRLTLGYRLSQFPAADRTLTTHGVDASAYAPLTPRIALSVRGGLSDGDGLGSARLYSALWVRL